MTLPNYFEHPGLASPQPRVRFRAVVRAAKRREVEAAIHRNGGNKTAAAAELGISRATVIAYAPRAKTRA